MRASKATGLIAGVVTLTALGGLAFASTAPKLPGKTPPAKDELADKLATHLLTVQARAGTMAAAKGKENQALVREYQADNSLKVDGLAGPNTIEALARDGVGRLPLVMYWPKGSTRAAAVATFRERIEDLADDAKDAALAAALRQSAQREQGQAFG